ncbi:glycosyltransferase family 9 protein [Thermanaerovibrio acidaminovorans]|uniref:glycosyltransferase family 9 protein n=1 Tax=Thermanaerovibrio acidaminovorans TaxID=81462 RepID=UPI0024902E8F|nr:glycosyltransferase family 9 protein [Thermanaerovibrio acidaminovorans]
MRSLPMPQGGDRLLFVRFSSLGDVILAAYEAKALKERFPELELWWLCIHHYREMLASQPYVDGVISLEDHQRRSPRALWELVGRIRDGGFRFMYSLHRGDRTDLMALFSRIGVRIGSHRRLPWAFNRTLDEARSAWGISAPSGKVLYGAPERLEAMGRLVGDGGFVLCAVGTSKPYKTWPPERWAELAGMLIRHGLRVVLAGNGPEEAQAARLVEDSLGETTGLVNLVDRIDLLDLIALEEMALCVVGGDTGPLHMARPIGTRRVGLFSVRDPERVGGHVGPMLWSIISPRAVDSYRELEAASDSGAVMGAIDPHEVLRAVMEAVRQVEA